MNSQINSCIHGNQSGCLLSWFPHSEPLSPSPYPSTAMTFIWPLTSCWFRAFTFTFLLSVVYNKIFQNTLAASFFFIEMLMTNRDWGTMIQYIPPNKSKGGSKRADWSLLWINLKYTCIYTFQDFCIRDQYLNNWFTIISI